jgi:hypothetical protein
VATAAIGEAAAKEAARHPPLPRSQHQGLAGLRSLHMATIFLDETDNAIGRFRVEVFLLAPAAALRPT